jgi:hypothetical protein
MKGDSLEYRYSQGIKTFPSAFMSPGYVAFLLPFLALNNSLLANILIIFFQVCISTVTILLLFRFTEKLFTLTVALLSALTAALLPDIAFAVSSFTPTVMFHLVALVLLILLYEESRLSNKKWILVLSILCSIGVYLRSEFILFVLMLSVLFIIERRWRDGMLILFVTIALLMPWTIRNSSAFGEFVPLGNGLGLNLYRGNNPYGIGNWGDATIKQYVPRLPQTEKFELALDSLYRAHAIDFIIHNPECIAQYSIEKLFHLWIYIPLQPRHYYGFYQAISITILLFFLVGIVSSWSWKRHKYFYIFFIYSTIIAIIFFTLPRHQTMMRIGMLPFIGIGMAVVWNKIKSRFLKTS